MREQRQWIIWDIKIQLVKYAESVLVGGSVDQLSPVLFGSLCE